MIIKPVLYTDKGYHTKNNMEYLLYGLFAGIIIVMIIYNLFIYITIRDIFYLYYILVILGIGMHQLAFTGLAYEFLWPDSPRLNYYIQPLLIGYIVFWGILFSKNYLMTKIFSPIYNKVLIFIMVCSCMLMLSVFFFTLKEIALAKNLIPLGAVVSLIIATAISWYKGYRPAKFYFIAWSSILFGTIVFISRGLGYLPHNILTSNSMQISTIITVILLSLALTDRINLLKKEHFEAQENIIKNQNSIMENLKKTDSMKNEFLLHTSHEIKTPLIQIIAIAETILFNSSTKMNSSEIKSLLSIITTGKRLSTLVSDILDYSKLRMGDLRLNLKSVNVKEVADTILFLQSETATGKIITLSNQIRDEDKYVLGDENRLHQIIFNIVDNAVKNTNSGSVSIHSEKTDDLVQITISDTGTGIPAAKLETLFSYDHNDRILLNSIEGSGIGLTITKKLIELHGGTIHVESKGGSGTKVIFTCPAAERTIESANVAEKRHNLNISYKKFNIPDLISNVAGAQNPQYQDPQAPKIKNKNATILVVDDEPINIQVLINQLNLAGYNVITASNGAQAIDILEKKIIPDLILLDIMMPGMSGFETCKKIREKFTLYKIPVIMLTIRDQVKDLIEAFNVGANDYLTKPFDKLELLARVETLLTLKQLVKEYEETKYREMQKRMNPHFLFNALHTIHALMQRKPESAEKGIIMLADIYRFIIDKSFTTLIPCELELNFIEKYLEIEKLRFPDTLEYEMNIQGSFHDVLIPPFTLQPIVENSIKHGLRNITGNGFVNIFASRMDTIIKFEVIDNGAGLKDSNLFARSLGIIRDRLKFHYNESMMEILPRAGGGTHVTISIKLTT